MFITEFFNILGIFKRDTTEVNYPHMKYQDKILGLKVKNLEVLHSIRKHGEYKLGMSYSKMTKCFE
jgi:hypothetical protein